MTRANPIRAAREAGRKARGVCLSFPAPALVEILAPCGLDFVLIDGEHGGFGPEAIEAVCRAAENAGVMPVARVPDLAGSTIGRFLDRGVLGILGPHIASLADARQLVDACLFPPDGARSFGATRAQRHGQIDDLASHARAANAGLWIGALLEDRAALAQLDEILSVERIDHFAIGAFDLALSLGQPPDGAEVGAAIAEIGRRVHAAGRRMREDDIVFAWDRDILRAGAANLLAT